MKPLAPLTNLQNRYQITRLIGKGGMGEVYLAVDTRLGHSVALKRTTVGDDAVLAEAFEQEARTLAGLRHPVLPKVSDHFVGDSGQFLVMDYIDGEDLAKRLKTSAKPFPLDWVLFWADQLLDALGYLHKHDPPIIHRDIKPQNLKLTKENQIILLDFGLSKRTMGDTKVTSSGSVVGYTPHYAPMEQIRGTGTNARSDVYSLSATLYQLLTATIPPDALTRADAMLGGSPDPIKPLTALNDQISDLLSTVILKGMELSQEKRYPTAREMQKELRKAFNQLRESMSAETVAFNINDEGIGASDAKTEVISDFKIDETPVVSTPPVPVVLDSAPSPDKPEPPVDFSADKTEVIDVSEIRSIANDEEFQSTMKKDFYSEEAVEESEVLKTEAYSADQISGASQGSVYETKEDYDDLETPSVVPEDYASEDFSPEATVPLISLDEGVVGENSVSSDADASSSFANTDYSVDADIDEPTNDSEPAIDDQPEREAVPVASGVVASESKSSTGKYVAILGGLGALLLLLVVTVVAIGWYVSNGGFGNGKVETETPTPTVAETPEDEATPEPANTDVIFDDGNSNTELNTELSNSESPEPPTTLADVTTTTPTRTSTPRSTRTPTRTSTPRTRTTRRSTQRPARKPRRKPTPKPTRKPKGKDPGILQ